MTLTDNKLRLYLTGEFPQTLKKFTNSWFYETNLEQCDFIFYHELIPLSIYVLYLELQFYFQ